MFGLAVVSPLVGSLMDRFGIRRVIACSAVVFGLATAAMALQNGSKALWVWLSVLVGVSGRPPRCWATSPCCRSGSTAAWAWRWAWPCAAWARAPC